MGKFFSYKNIDYYLLSILFFFPAINYYIAQLFYSFKLANPYSHIIYFIIYGAGCVSYVKSFSFKSFIYICILIILLNLSFALNPGLFDLISGPKLLTSQLLVLVLSVFPIFLLTTKKGFNFQYAFNVMYYFALFVLILIITAFYFTIILNKTGLEEYMTFAYTGLPSILIIFYFSWFVKDVKYKNLARILSVLGIITIVTGGCRGAFLTIIAFVFLSTIFSMKNKRQIIGLSIIGILLFLFSWDILKFILDNLSLFGYDSRIGDFLESKNFAESQGRIKIYSKAYSLISIGGRGIFSDRILLESVDNAKYCHNWILEMLVDYGWILGVVVIVYILFALIRGVLNTFNRNVPEFYVFMTCFALSILGVKLSLSQSYLNSIDFALILGWLLNNKIYAHHLGNEVNQKTLKEI